VAIEQRFHSRSFCITEAFQKSYRVPLTLGIAQRRQGPNCSAPSKLFFRVASEVSYLVQVFNIDRDRNIGRVAVIEEMFQTDLKRNRADHFAEAWRLQIFDLPYFEHQPSE